MRFSEGGICVASIQQAHNAQHFHYTIIHSESSVITFTTGPSYACLA
jgi:hypothetical protein